MKVKQARASPPKVTRAGRKASRLYRLKLYVAGQSPKSVNAIANIKQLCEANLSGRYVLEVIDLYQQPQLARGEQIQGGCREKPAADPRRRSG